MECSESAVHHPRPVGAEQEEPPSKVPKLDGVCPSPPASLSFAASSLSSLNGNEGENAGVQQARTVEGHVGANEPDAEEPLLRDPAAQTEELSMEDVKFPVSAASVSGIPKADGASVRIGLASDLGAVVIKEGDRNKTSLCSYFRKDGCRHGLNCRFAHGEEELRPRPDGSWDPTSEHAKALLRKGTPAGEMAVAPVIAGGEDKDGSSANSLSKCITNLPRNWSVDYFKEFLAENGILYTTAKKRKGMTVAFVGFKTSDDVLKAVQILDGKTVSTKQLKVSESRPRSWEKEVPKADEAGRDEAPESIDDKGRLEADNDVDMGVGDSELAALSREGGGVEPRNVCDAVTPLAHMGYAEQLSLKRENIAQVLKRLVRNTRKGIPSQGVFPDWISSARDRGGLPCTLEGVQASPLIDGYRNKCEFTIGSSDDGKRVVGFQIGSFREGILAVAEPGDCRNVSPIARSYAAVLQEFVRQSELPVWHKPTNSGFWRLLIVREGRAAALAVEGSGRDALDEAASSISEAMLVVQVCPNGVDDERRAVEYAHMADFVSRAAQAASPPLPLTAMLVQDHVGISNVAPPDAPLHSLEIPHSKQSSARAANEFIHDHIGSLKFRISPTAFFQVNTLAAERLFTLAGDWAGLTADTLLFDICCGTGTIGLTLAHRVGLVVGIEMNASAVADAKKNAEINSITNYHCVCSKAEDVIGGLLKKYCAQEEPPSVEDDSKPGGGPSDDGLHPLPLASERTSPNSSAGDYETNRTAEAAVPGSNNGLVADRDGRAAAAESIAREAPSTSATDEVKQRGPTPKFKNVVAIVDPPRVGLHPVVLKTLRLHTELRRIVYISCNPSSLLANAVELCTPLANDSDAKEKGGGGGWQGRAGWKGISYVGLARRRAKKMPPSEPFKPVRAIAVDLFPHTAHCEMVMLLER